MWAPPRPLQRAALQIGSVAAPAAAPATRVKDAAVCCPLVYGSFAFWLGRKADEFHTHKWTLFVRGPHGEDLGYFVEKVVFKLHPSFAQPVREVTKPPFEVSEKGWGEFECHIRVHFKDPTAAAAAVARANPRGGGGGHAAARRAAAPLLRPPHHSPRRPLRRAARAARRRQGGRPRRAAAL